MKQYINKTIKNLTKPLTKKEIEKLDDIGNTGIMIEAIIICLFFFIGIPMMNYHEYKPYMEKLNQICPVNTISEVDILPGLWAKGSCIGNDSIIRYELNNGTWLKLK